MITFYKWETEAQGEGGPIGQGWVSPQCAGELTA